MKFTITEHTQHLLTLDDGRELDLSFAPTDKDKIKVEQLPNGVTVVGYLVQDDDCANPLEDSDVGGKILRRYHAAGRDEQRASHEAMGIDEDGNQTGTRNPLAVLLDCYRHGGEAWRCHGSGKFFPDENWDVSNCAGVWVPGDYTKADIEMGAGTRLLQEQVSDPAQPVALTQRYMGSKRKKKAQPYTYGWTFSGASRQGYVSPLRAALGLARRFELPFNLDTFQAYCYEEAVKQATSDVEVYNDWLSGNVYGVCVDVFDAQGEKIDDEERACWGFIGDKHAQSSLDETFTHICTRQRKEVPVAVSDRSGL